MATRQPLQLPAPLYVRLLALLMCCVISGLGLLALITGQVAARSTRFGYVGPLQGIPAHSFGLSMVFFGLLPLMLCARTPKSAMWIAAGSVTLGLLAVFAGAFLWH